MLSLTLNQKLKIVVGLQAVAMVSAVIDGHTKFFNGYFDVLAWGAFILSIVMSFGILLPWFFKD